MKWLFSQTPELQPSLSRLYHDPEPGKRIPAVWCQWSPPPLVLPAFRPHHLERNCSNSLGFCVCVYAHNWKQQLTLPNIRFCRPATSLLSGSINKCLNFKRKKADFSICDPLFAADLLRVRNCSAAQSVYDK